MAANKARIKPVAAGGVKTQSATYCVFLCVFNSGSVILRGDVTFGGVMILVFQETIHLLLQVAPVVG